MSPRTMSPFSTRKRCPKCRRSLTLDAFRKLTDREGRSRRQSYCRDCELAWAREEWAKEVAE